MRIPRLAIVPLALVAATIAVPALAAPDRTGAISAAAPAYKWDGGPGNGVGQSGGVVPLGAARCQPVVYECEDTLVELKDGGTLTVEIKAGSGSNDLDVRFFKTDSTGEIPADQDGNPEDISENADAKITARGLKPGFYLIRVAFFNATQGVYSGTATLATPPPAAPAPAPTAAPAPAATPAPKPAKKKTSKRKACEKKAKKIKNKKKRSKALKKCKKIKG